MAGGGQRPGVRLVAALAGPAAGAGRPGAPGARPGAICVRPACPPQGLSALASRGQLEIGGTALRRVGPGRRARAAAQAGVSACARASRPSCAGDPSRPCRSTRRPRRQPPRRPCRAMTAGLAHASTRAATGPRPAAPCGTPARTARRHAEKRHDEANHASPSQIRDLSSHGGVATRMHVALLLVQVGGRLVDGAVQLIRAGKHSIVSQAARASSAAWLALLVRMGPLSSTSTAGLLVCPGCGR